MESPGSCQGEALSAMRNSFSTFRRVVSVGAMLLFIGGLTLSVFAALVPRFPGDLPVALWVQALATPWLDTVMEAVTLLAQTYVAGASILAVAVAFALVRRWPEVVAFLGVAVMEGVVQVAKSLIGRPRPPEELLRIVESGSGDGFPSGHAYHAVVFGGLLLLLVVANVRPVLVRRAVEVVVMMLILVVGISRVYLGAHWPSDVLGSVALGTPSVVLLTYLYHRLGSRGSVPPEGGQQS